MYETTRTTMPGHDALTLRATLPGYDREGELWSRLASAASPGALPLMTEEPPCWSIYHDEEYVEGPVDVEIVQPVRAPVEVPGLESRRMPAQDLLAVTHRGSYRGLPDAFTALGQAIDDSGLTVAGPMIARYLIGPAHTRDEEQYVTEVCAPVK